MSVQRGDSTECDDHVMSARGRTLTRFGASARLHLSMLLGFHPGGIWERASFPKRANCTTVLVLVERGPTPLIGRCLLRCERCAGDSNLLWTEHSKVTLPVPSPSHQSLAHNSTVDSINILKRANLSQAHRRCPGTVGCLLLEAQMPS